MALRKILLNSNKTVYNISSNTLDRRTIRFKKVFNVNNSLHGHLAAVAKNGETICGKKIRGCQNTNNDVAKCKAGISGLEIKKRHYFANDIM